MAFIANFSISSDFMSGFYNIIATNTVNILIYEQMVCFGPIIIDGILLNDGEFIGEP